MQNKNSQKETEFFSPNNPSTEEKKKVQIQRRLKKHIVPCDKLSNHPFNYSTDEYADILEYRDQCGCVEIIKKGKKVVTPYWLELVEGYVDLSPLNAFHREVLFSVISAYEQGFRFITFRTALHNLTGGNQKYIRKEQYTAIKQAIDKLGFTRIEIDLAPLFKAMPKYKDNYTGEARIVGTLLPCRYFNAEINGQKTLAIELLGESPLMTVAKLKKQILTYDTTPLAISGQNNTPQVITIKNYLLRRINLIERGLNSSILLDTIYAECGLANADKWQKQDSRKILVDVLKSLKADGVIQNFEFKRDGRAYRSIKIIIKSPRRLSQNSP
ncbi:MAG: hypothetical protein IJP61_07100 [Treponema sp.]|nr:hypothetical protein [Treponema sp.]